MSRNGRSAAMEAKSNSMTREEKEYLVSKVTDLLMRDVLSREDSVIILRICSNACDRRIRELERSEPARVGNVQ